MKAVFIGGFLHPTNWIPFNPKEVPDDIELILLYPSPVGSIHDRICQIFYELVGGCTDYGEIHSRFHNHLRYGRTFTNGKHSNWSEKNPLYFIGLLNIFSYHIYAKYS